MSQKFNLLLVDDDPVIGSAVKTVLPSHWRLIYAPTEEGINYLFPYHAAFIDMHLNSKGENARGLKVIEKLRTSFPLLEIVAISGDMSLELMENGLKMGAQRFLAKPLAAAEILLHLSKIEALIQIRNASQNLLFEGPKWVGTSPQSEQIRTQIAGLRGEYGPILISGESGSGKEVACRLIHEQENNGPLVAVNLAGITDSLFESEFFGHIKGAFTGADTQKIGLIEAAAGGDLFLDEIEALPLNLQAKLLRFLETGEFKKVGHKETQKAHCRVLCATNRDLSIMVKEGTFREDLYWRISGKKVSLSPLRERTEDISDLAQHFLSNDRPRRNKRLSEDAISALTRYSWPGNVRELKRVCEQLSLTSPLPLIRGVDVLQVISIPSIENNFTEFDSDLSLNELTSRFEANIIKKILLKNSNDINKTATELKISKSNLYKKIKDYQLEIIP